TPYPAASGWPASWPASRWLGTFSVSACGWAGSPSGTLFPATPAVGAPGLGWPFSLAAGGGTSTPVRRGGAPLPDRPVPVNGEPVVSPVWLGVEEGANQVTAPLAAAFTGSTGSEVFFSHTLTSSPFPAVTGNGRVSGSL